MAQVKISGWMASLTSFPPTLALVHCYIKECQSLPSEGAQGKGWGATVSSLRETVDRPPELFGRRSSPKGLRSAGAHSAPRVESSTNRAVTRPPCTLRKGLKRCNPSGMHNCTFIINCLPKKLPYNYQEILTRIETLRESAHIFNRVHVVASFQCFEIIFALRSSGGSSHIVTSREDGRFGKR